MIGKMTVPFTCSCGKRVEGNGVDLYVACSCGNEFDCTGNPVRKGTLVSYWYDDDDGGAP